MLVWSLKNFRCIQGGEKRLKEMIVWALFDSGNGSYTKAIKTLNEAKEANIDVYPIGIDIEHKNSHFIELDLADYKRLFGDNTLFDTLDKLPNSSLLNTCTFIICFLLSQI